MRASASALIAATRSKRQRARHPDDDLAHDLGAAGPEPDRLDSGHAPGVDDERADGVGQTLGRAVDQRVDRRPAQTIAGDRDETGDADGGQRVGMRISGPGGGKAQEHEHGRDEVARIMQRVGQERMARGHARHMGQRAPAQSIGGDRKHDRADGEGVHVDGRAALADALHRLDRDADRECGEKAGLGQRRHRLELGVAEGMIGVGGFVGFAHGVEGQRARADIERVMRAFRKKRERAGGEPGRELDDGQDQAGRDRGRRRARLQRRRRLGRILRLRSQCERSADLRAVR